MIVELQEYVAERGELLVGQVRKLRANVCRERARSRFRLCREPQVAEEPSPRDRPLWRQAEAVSQSAVQNLIELQAEIVTSALTDVALRLERATRAATSSTSCATRSN